MSMSLRETLQLTVAALMHATGDSQSELAGALGLTQTQVSRRQAGRTAWTLDDCDRLAAHFGLPVLDVLAGPTRACELLSAARRRTVHVTRGAARAARGSDLSAQSDSGLLLNRPSFSHEEVGR
ncbi:helix-turn-helix domain-containing protein [Streptomyces sp. NBC_01142]|uniref:helix-turn-helix domain-containing protein n=1 Tax=Streptomyces sp. NBC_01142 TaxID=2975865 RepID=UPI002252E712|nr:helix-turn-helix transcriptional regulator [Streptomyces sp. NBC_01142]MCX4821191.1 helix-turn-helix domain-containing protein [Streptomyces sp. NBC_01142]